MIKLYYWVFGQWIWSLQTYRAMSKAWCVARCILPKKPFAVILTFPVSLVLLYNSCRTLRILIKSVIPRGQAVLNLSH